MLESELYKWGICRHVCLIIGNNWLTLKSFGSFLAKCFFLFFWNSCTHSNHFYWWLKHVLEWSGVWGEENKTHLCTHTAAETSKYLFFCSNTHTYIVRRSRTYPHPIIWRCIKGPTWNMWPEFKSSFKNWISHTKVLLGVWIEQTYLHTGDLNIYIVTGPLLLRLVQKPSPRQSPSLNILLFRFTFNPVPPLVTSSHQISSKKDNNPDEKFKRATKVRAELWKVESETKENFDPSEKDPIFRLTEEKQHCSVTYNPLN